MNLLPVAQPIPATPPAHGLLVTADEATDLPFEPIRTDERADNGDGGIPADRWGQGFVVQPENCVEASTWDPDCDSWPASNPDGTKGAAAAKSTAGTNETSYEVHPFVIETPFLCDAGGFQAVDYRGRARRQLSAATSKAMEYEFATGTLKGASGNPFLQDAGSVVVIDSGSSFSPVDALVRLGAALSACGHGGRGMIHAPTAWVDKLMSTGSDMVKEVGNRLVTVGRSDRIVSGTGYPGLGPGGAAPPAGDVYVYATGPVMYRLSDEMVFPDTLREAMDRKKNNVEYRAEREAAVYFDPCCHFVIQSTVWSALP